MWDKESESEYTMKTAKVTEGRLDNSSVMHTHTFCLMAVLLWTKTKHSSPDKLLQNLSVKVFRQVLSSGQETEKSLM